jgi:hypothetical protein
VPYLVFAEPPVRPAVAAARPRRMGPDQMTLDEED